MTHLKILLLILRISTEGLTVLHNFNDLDIFVRPTELSSLLEAVYVVAVDLECHCPRSQNKRTLGNNS